jgi:hypothetical protein
MTLIGHVFDGKVVLEGPVSLPNGTAVRVEPVDSPVQARGNANPLVGFLANDLELANHIVDSAMTSRETRALRMDGG